MAPRAAVQGMRLADVLPRPRVSPKEKFMIYPAARSSKELEEMIQHERDELRQLRDEIRLKIHLAGMEARAIWADIEKQLEQIEERFGYAGDHVIETTRRTMAKLRASLHEFKKTLAS
jgi:ElaB/YqjD/DUF883 family membrane-anchored ribosome-binding protein